MVEVSGETKEILSENIEESKEETKLLEPEEMYKWYYAEDLYIKMPSEHNPITPEEQMAINKRLIEEER